MEQSRLLLNGATFASASQGVWLGDRILRVILGTSKTLPGRPQGGKLLSPHQAWCMASAPIFWRELPAGTRFPHSPMHLRTSGPGASLPGLFTGDVGSGDLLHFDSTSFCSHPHLFPSPSLGVYNKADMFLGGYFYVWVLFSVLQAIYLILN